MNEGNAIKNVSSNTYLVLWWRVVYYSISSFWKPELHYSFWKPELLGQFLLLGRPFFKHKNPNKPYRRKRKTILQLIPLSPAPNADFTKSNDKLDETITGLREKRGGLGVTSAK